MKSLKLLSAVLLATILAVPAFAQTSTPNIDQRQDFQQQRIGQGLQSGALSAGEAQRLEEREVRIAKAKQMAQADGVVTRQERAKIHRKQDRTSLAIYHKKHNAVHQ